MHYFEIQPLSGVGPVKLGATRAEVHQALGLPSSSFKKTSTSKHETDAWFENGFQVFYGGEVPLVEYIELSSHSGFGAQLLGRDVFSTEAALLVTHVQTTTAFDPADPELGYSYVFPSIEISFWRPDDEDEYFSTVGAGAQGYYSVA